MKKTVLVILADGFEEIEAVTPIDILRRAELDVVVAGAGKSEVTGSRGLKIKADVELEKYSGVPDAVVLPGGSQGAANLRDSKAVAALLKKMRDEKKTIAAICASPAVVLAKTGILEGKRATCYPGFEKHFTPSIHFVADRVVTDGDVITSRGPGSALEFSLEIVARLVDRQMADKLSDAVLAKV